MNKQISKNTNKQTNKLKVSQSGGKHLHLHKIQFILTLQPIRLRIAYISIHMARYQVLLIYLLTYLLTFIIYEEDKSASLR